MEVFWAILATVVLVMISTAWLSGRREKKKAKTLRGKFIDELEDYVRSGERYDVVLTDRTRFEDVKLVGLSTLHDGTLMDSQYAQGRWMILERTDARRIFLRPQAVRYFEQRNEKEPNKALDPTRVSRPAIGRISED